MRSADGKTTNETSFFGIDGRTETQIQILSDGTQRQTSYTKAPSAVANKMPDAAY